MLRSMICTWLLRLRYGPIVERDHRDHGEQTGHTSTFVPKLPAAVAA